MLGKRGVSQLLHQVQLLGRVEMMEEFKSLTVEFRRAAYPDFVPVACSEDAHIATHLVLEADSQTEKLGRLLGVEIHLVVGTDAHNGEIEPVAFDRLIDGRDVDGKGATLVVDGLVRFQELVHKACGWPLGFYP